MQQFNIDPDFSVYQLTRRSTQDSAILNHRETMSAISHEIENATLIDGAETVIFSSFQRMSRFLPQVNRYRQMASKSKHIYVFGIMDTELPHIENITYVPLKPDDQLAKEWFIVSFGPDYFSALATEELTDIDDPDHKRQFKGVWSFDRFLVGILHEWLSGIVGLRHELQGDSPHDYLRHAQVISNTIGRMAVRLNDKSGVIHNELHHLMHNNLHPTYHHLKETQSVRAVDDSTMQGKA